MIPTTELDAFVALSDELGGPDHPDCLAYWEGVRFKLETVVDESLDPLSEAYVEQQLAVYGELSGRAFDQTVNEYAELDVDLHTEAINPYDHPSPGILSLHVERLSRAIRHVAPPKGGTALDMGCGWGLSAETMAYAGLSVVAVDVNPAFVDLVNRRAERLGHDITAYHGTFDEFESDQKFDLILFYECLHHALRPWTVLRRMADMLTPNGSIVLAGEPIGDTFWKHWGLRLDPMSVYCIRKFGWFESGFSQPLIRRAVVEAGLKPRVVRSGDSAVGKTILGRRLPLVTVPASEIEESWSPEGWFSDRDYLISGGTSSVVVAFPPEARTAFLTLQNFRGKPMTVQVRVGDRREVTRELPPGPSSFWVERDEAAEPVTFTTEPWSPAAELGTDDHRMIGFHLESATFV